MEKFAIRIPHLNIDGAVAVSEKQLNEAASAIEDQVRLHRFGEAAEIAKAAPFLASDDSSFMTGSKLVVEGGISQL
jgi:NAD(P)-dependent dehydrogenase (short-subunit alcohol dehydrogenase family)